MQTATLVRPGDCSMTQKPLLVRSTLAPLLMHAVPPLLARNVLLSRSQLNVLSGRELSACAATPEESNPGIKTSAPTIDSSRLRMSPLPGVPKPGRCPGIPPNCHEGYSECKGKSRRLEWRGFVGFLSSEPPPWLPRARGGGNGVSA